MIMIVRAIATISGVSAAALLVNQSVPGQELSLVTILVVVIGR